MPPLNEDKNPNGQPDNGAGANGQPNNGSPENGAKPENGKPEAKAKGKPLGEIAGNDDEGQDDGEKDKGKKKPSVFETMMDLKEENRELRGIIRDEIVPALKLLKGGATKNSSDLDALAEKYELKPEFVKDLYAVVKDSTQKELEGKFGQTLEDIQKDSNRKSKAAQISAAINQEFDRVVKETPELEKMVNKEAVKQYIMRDYEKNSQRAMEDIIEEMYPAAFTGNASIEGYKPKGGNAPEEMDFNNLTPEDHRKIATNPELKAKYADNLIERLTGGRRSRHEAPKE